MGKRKTRKQLEDVRRMALGGALAIKSTDVLRHAGSPSALAGDVQGFVGIGITGAMSEAASGGMDMIYGKKKRKRKRR